MVAKLDNGEYMAFGLSGDPRRTKMIGGKFSVVFQKIYHAGQRVDFCFEFMILNQKTPFYGMKTDFEGATEDL